MLGPHQGSRHRVASCCHPNSLSLGSGESARKTVVLSIKVVRKGTPNPASVKRSTHVLTASKNGDGSMAIPYTMVVSTVGWRSCTMGAIGPTCPVNPLSQPACCRESQSSDGERKRCRDSGHIVVWCNSQDLAETLPHACIMALRECFSEDKPYTSTNSSPSWKRTSTAATKLPVQLECVGTILNVLPTFVPGNPTGTPRILTPCCHLGNDVSHDNGLKFQSAGCTGEDVHPRKWNSTSVPHLGLPVMHRDLRVVQQILL